MQPADEIAGVRRAYMDAFNRGDADAVAALHTARTISMPADMPAITGRDSVRALMAASLSAKPPGLEFVFEPSDVRIADGWAVERGITLPAGAFPGGKYVMLYEREADGCWRIAWSITNSDRRVPGP